MLYSEDDALRIGRWCQAVTTPELRRHIYLLPMMHDDQVTIYEYQTALQRYYVFAHLAYDSVTRMWTLFSRHRKGGFTRYAGVAPTRDVQRILDFLWDCDDQIFVSRRSQFYQNPERWPK